MDAEIVPTITDGLYQLYGQISPPAGCRTIHGRYHCSFRELAHGIYRWYHPSEILPTITDGRYQPYGHMSPPAGCRTIHGRYHCLFRELAHGIYRWYRPCSIRVKRFYIFVIFLYTIVILDMSGYTTGSVYAS